MMRVVTGPGLRGSRRSRSGGPFRGPYGPGMSLPAHMTSAAGAAAAIRDELAAGDAGFAMRLLAEAVTTGFRSLHPAGQATWLATPPPSTGDPRWDALLAGVAEHLAMVWGHPVPAWASLHAPLEEPWFPGGTAGDVLDERVCARTWPELGRRGIHLDPAELIAI